LRLINSPSSDSLAGKEVRLLDSNGQEVAIVPFSVAMTNAHSEGLDLVELAPDAKPPVVRVMDYGKFIYEKKKQQKDARKKQMNNNQVKELKFHVNIHDHDFETKLKHASEFVGKGYKLKITLQFRAREMAHPELGDVLMKRIIEALGETVIIEAKPKLMGRNMSMQLSPNSKKA
jgi:translation initiation factor IF-3